MDSSPILLVVRGYMAQGASFLVQKKWKYGSLSQNEKYSIIIGGNKNLKLYLFCIVRPGGGQLLMGCIQFPQKRSLYPFYFWTKCIYKIVYYIHCKFLIKEI